MSGFITYCVHKKFFCVLPALIVLSLLASSSGAQWKMLKSFGAEVYTVHYLDREGFSKIGFAGLTDGSVWRTSDAGLSWARTATPNLPIGSVRDFTFKDSLTGWFTHFLPNSNTAAVFKTTDGGVTWNALTLQGVGTAIFYDQHSNVLIESQWTGLQISTDLGTTWTVVAGTENFNMCGIAFVDSVHGLASVAFPQLNNPGNYMITTDGGLSWQNTSEKVEAWQPTAIKNTGTYFVSGEGVHQILQSNDTGRSWNLRHQFANTDNITGDICGDIGALYIQLKSGTMYSVDSGKTWTDYCGPGNDFDTRMYDLNDTLYAGDLNGNLWYNPFGIKKNNLLLQFPNPHFDLVSEGCLPVDSVFHLYNLSNCLAVHLVSAHILPNASSKYFTLNAGTTPRLLKDTSFDSLVVTFSPNGSTTDSVTLELKYTVGSQSFTVDVIVRGFIKPGFNVILSKNLNLLVSSDCAKVDTFVTVKSGPCGADTIAGIKINDPANVFTITKPTLPAGIAAGASLQIPVSVNSVAAGSYNATITLTILSGGITRDTTFSIAATILPSGVARANITPSAEKFDTVSICSLALDTIYLKNSICKKLYIKNVSIQPALAATEFTIMNAGILPDSLLQNDTLGIIVQYKPTVNGNIAGTIHFSIGFDLTNTRDTFINISGSGKTLPSSDFQPNGLVNFSGVPCQLQDIFRELHNSSCSTDTLVSFIFARDFSVLGPMLPVIILSGDSAAIHVGIDPLSPGAKSDSIGFVLHTSSGAFDTVYLLFAGIVSQPQHKLEFNTLLQLDSLAPCTPFDTTIEIKNLGLCDTLVIDSAVLSGPNWFALGSISLPSRILPDSIFFLKLHLTPGAKANGSGSIHIKGNGIDTTISINANSMSGGKAITLTQTGSLVSTFCNPASDTFSYQNTSCDTVIISKLSLTQNIPGSTQFSLSPNISLPDTLLAGEKLVVMVIFDPSGVGDSTAKLQFISKQFSRTDPLIGSVGSSKQTARFGLAINGNQASASIVAGGVFTLNLVLENTLDTALGLKKIDATIVSYPDVFGLISGPSAGTGWILNSANPPNPNGSLTLDLSPNGASGLAAGSVLATMKCEVFVADSAFTPISVENIYFNGGDSTFASCVLSPLGMQSPITLYTDPKCGDITLRKFLNDDYSFFQIISIRPNPVAGGSQIHMSLKMNEQADVNFYLHDALGREVMHSVKPSLAKGLQNISFELPKGAGGLYILTTQAGGIRASSKIVIEP